MNKRAVLFLLCLSIIVNTYPINALAKDSSNESYAQISSEIKEDYEIDENIAIISSMTVANRKTVIDMLEQSKFKARQGHGFAAERGNNLVDKIKGKNTVVVGDNNVKNGPDRIIRNKDGTTIWIQDKYYRSFSESINACFDETGTFRYFDSDNKPMQIEVPKDQYTRAVETMKNKIRDGKVPGVTDPEEAVKIVRKGSLTYKQAVNLAKAGTLESLTYDTVNGTVSAAGAFGISTLLNYAVCRFNGEDRITSIKNASIDGIKTGGLALCSSVVSNQLTKTSMVKAFEPAAESVVKTFGDDFAKVLVKSTGKTVAEEGSAAVTKQAAKALNSNVVTAVVTTIVFTVPDAKNMFDMRISEKQFVKNFSVTAASVAGGTAGGIGGGALGTSIAPGIGTTVGTIIGGLVGGSASGLAADKISDKFYEGDAKEMYRLLQEAFLQKCEDYMVNDSEAQNIAEALSKKLNDDVYKDMYESDDGGDGRENYIDKLLDPLFKNEISKREPIETPTEEEVRNSLKEELKGIIYIH